MEITSVVIRVKPELLRQALDRLSATDIIANTNTRTRPMILNPDLDLSVTRHIAASPARIWTAWSDPVELAKWWCPRPWTTQVKAFDFRPGGAFHTLMTGPDGVDTSDNPGAFVAITPHRQIIFTSALLADWRPAHQPWMPMTAIFTLEAQGEGTRYTATAMHPDKATCASHAQMGFNEGWTTCMDQLAELVEG